MIFVVSVSQPYSCLTLLKLQQDQQKTPLELDDFSLIVFKETAY